MRAPAIGALSLAVTLALTGMPAAEPALAAGNVSGLFIDGEPGDRVSGSDQWAFVSPEFTIAPTPGPVSPDRDHVSLSVEGESWTVSINAPAGQSLTAGTSFPAGTGVVPAGSGILWVTGRGAGCSLADGGVTVLEATFTGADVVTSFAADFWMDCDDGNSAKLFGSIRYQSSFGIRAVTVDPDSVAFDDTLVGTPSASRVITIENHGTSAVQFSDPVFEGPDADAFEIVGTPCAVVLPGATCTVEVRLDASTRGAKQASLVIPDSTVRGERLVALTGAAYQATSTTMVITDPNPGGAFGPAVTISVSPNPGPSPYPGGRRVRIGWTDAGGAKDPGQTEAILDPLTGSAEDVPLGIPQGTWIITASFLRQDYFETSSAQIVGVHVPQKTWLTVSSPDSTPGSSAFLTASVNSGNSAPLVPGSLSIRDATDTVVASRAVGGEERSLTAEVCCLAVGDHEFTATYVPDTDEAFGSSATWTHSVRHVVPSGIVFLNSGAAFTSSPVVTVHAEAFVTVGTVTRMQITNDGVDWHERDYATDFEWDLTDPALNGASFDGRHIVSMRWKTTDSEWGPIAGNSIELDRGLPTSTAPSSTVTTSSTTTGGAVPMSLRWAGTDDRSGVDLYQVARSTDGGTYLPIATALAAPKITQILGSGHTYRFRVRSVDVAGNTGTWAYGSVIRLTGVAQSSASVRYAGTWATSTSPTWWGGTARSSSRAGSTASYTFTGKSIAWVGLKGVGRGKANVYINGVLKATVDLYSATTKKQVVVWSANYGTSATRTITITVLGTANRPRVDIDGFIVGS
jgi:hypothetical protein